MKALIIGCGRVGSTIARQLLEEEWEVTVVDENEDALSRLGENWPGAFLVGHGMDADLLRAAGIEESDAVVVATDGDNTNIVISQVAQKRFGIECVVARHPRPGAGGLLRRARASHRVPDEDRDRHPRRGRPGVRDPAGARLMYVVVAGGGKVGANVARSLLRLGNEVTLIEQRRDRFERLEEEFEHQVQRGDATELFVLERAGITRPPDIMLALTGDDEDNMVICQLAKEKYGVPKVIARVNDPRNQPHFDLLGISPTVCATSSIMALVQHEVPEHELIHLLELRRGEPRDRRGADRQELAGRRQARRRIEAAGGRTPDLGHARRPSEIAVGSTTLEAGDQVLAILEPGKEDELRRVLLKR